MPRTRPARSAWGGSLHSCGRPRWPGTRQRKAVGDTVGPARGACAQPPDRPGIPVSQQGAGAGAEGSEVLRHPTPAAVVLLWHGRGPNEAHVLRRLATALHSDGQTVVIPDWDAGSRDGGAHVLRASLDHAVALTDGRPSVPLVLAGWSLGGAAALSLALSDVPSHEVAAVVGLGAATRERSPLDGTLPLERVRSGLHPPQLHLVHGLRDTVVPSAEAEEFAHACRAADVPCTLTLVASDHAGVVGTEFDPVAGICVPSDAPAATSGLDAAVQAVRAVAGP